MTLREEMFGGKECPCCGTIGDHHHSAECIDTGGKGYKTTSTKETISQIDNAADPKFQIGIMRNVEREIPKAKRKRTPNWRLVMIYLLGHTSKGGSTSCRAHCNFLGVDPDGYTFWEEGK